MKLFSLQALLSVTLASSTLALATGCGINATDLAQETAVPGASIQGTVYGGQQPISGAHLYLMAAAKTGYGAASTSLISSSAPGAATDSIGSYVTTTASGGFNLTGTYSCTPGTWVYMLAYGGNPGLSAGTNNTSSMLATVLGLCPSDSTFAGHISSLNINEVTTVATAYAIAGYATDYKHVAAANTSQSLAGLGSAFYTFFSLVGQGTGGAYSQTPVWPGYSTSGLSANGIIPQAKINSLANILAGCVNSTGGTNACTQLWNNAKTLSGGTVPTNTFDAILNIAHNPGANVAALLALNTATAPFNPQLKTAPNDWSIAIKFSAPNSSTPGRVAVDALGNIWIPNSTNNTLTQLTPNGAVASGTKGYSGGGMNAPITPTFDSSGNVWIANMGSSIVSKFTAAGSPAAASGYTTNNGAAGYGIVIDSSNGNAWVSGDTAVSALSAVGGLVNTVIGNTYNTAIVQHSNGSIWSTSYNNNTLTRYIAGVPVNFVGGGLANPTALATDSSGNFWIANAGSNGISHFNSLGVPISLNPIVGGGVNAAWSIAVDGLNNIWVGNTNGTISRFNTSGTAISPTTGYSNAITNALGVTTSSVGKVYGIAADQAGNLWVTNTDGSIYEYVGMAAPTNGAQTPSQAGTRP